jgi:hypothetical protein
LTQNQERPKSSEDTTNPSKENTGKYIHIPMYYVYVIAIAASCGAPSPFAGCFVGVPAGGNIKSEKKTK